MDKKLTLSLDKGTIESAKRYARSNNISLSKLIASYLKTLRDPKINSVKITPLVEGLSGVISLDEDFDEKDINADYLIEKYKRADY